ncbi:ribonuclease P protein component [candidate division WOR-1 bacterium RIFOXYA2_FULL_36_21]|uniref:Ribonuclease P protein component n=1 Tax=candidate division WOR-1 bacterium RIFOXYB2_FULL_36_35 TaxID=1802578 RepID=A0A1F4S6Y2_UNCSA|nr:MAG: ribonuclease P protein component [candidate division WOR-1 bacterium RIFOXYA2_FULL_36_21]OGC16182.1 MAG: ribonuclease P protein component [candidate division WOR-1 bacterium RIFOXYB2_FULL_36_35]OGC16903.1 MAG: ribonuclease P protein component [candidate division WOR-1 bacterium RIFOXYA12_FULL_36_13]
MKSLKNREFEEVYKSGKKFYSSFFTLFFLSSQVFKYGLVVSKKHGSSVCRNKIKRRLKVIIGKIESKLLAPCFIVIIPKRGVASLNFEELVEKFINTAKRAKIIH